MYTELELFVLPYKRICRADPFQSDYITIGLYSQISTVATHNFCDVLKYIAINKTKVKIDNAVSLTEIHTENC